MCLSLHPSCSGHVNCIGGVSCSQRFTGKGALTFNLDVRVNVSYICTALLAIMGLYPSAHFLHKWLNVLIGISKRTIGRLYKCFDTHICSPTFIQLCRFSISNESLVSFQIKHWLISLLCFLVVLLFISLAERAVSLTIPDAAQCGSASYLSQDVLRELAFLFTC